MPIHDEYARLTPFELAFPPEGGALSREELESLAAGRPGDVPADPGRFLTLPSVSGALDRLQGPGEGPDAAHRHGLLLYHAFHFQRRGRPLFLLGLRATRYLVEMEGDAPEEDDLPLPDVAGYLQLPRHLFWIEPGEDGPPEPVDGIFWAAPEETRISLLAASGVRDDRPGFSVLPLPAVPLEHGSRWLETRSREEGPDFESTLPGGELDRLYSLETAGEVLKLMALVFLYVARFPGAVTSEEPLEEGEAGSPAPSALPYRRICLDT